MNTGTNINSCFLTNRFDGIFIKNNGMKIKIKLAPKLLLLFMVIFSGMAAAQENTPKIKHAFEGHGGGIVMMDNQRFFLFGYATLVFGSYSGTEANLQFKPDKFPAFAAFGRSEPSLQNKLRFRFVRFDEDDNYFQLGDNETVPVLNEDKNCVNSYLFKEFPNRKNDTKFTLMNDQEFEPYEDGINMKQFMLEGNNDFILIHHPMMRYYRDFEAAITKGKDGIILHTSAYDDFAESDRYSKDSDYDSLMEFAEMDQLEKRNELYVNEDENLVENYIEGAPGIYLETTRFINLKNYKADKTKNVLIFSGNPDELTNKYDRELRHYQEILSAKSVMQQIPAASKLKKPLFFSVCNDEKSYEYLPKSQLEEENQRGNDEERKLQMVPPPPHGKEE